MQIINVPGIGPVQFPDDMTDDQIVQAIERDILPQESARAQQRPQQPVAPQQPQEDRGLIGSAVDVAGNVIGSGISGAGSLATGLGALGGVAGLGYDNVVSRAGRGISEFGESMMSPELIEKRRYLARVMQEAESQGLAEEARAAASALLSNPSLLGYMAIEQIPAFVFSGGVGRATGLAAQRFAGGAGAAAGQRAAQAGAVGSAAALQGGSVADQTYQDVMGLPAATLESSPTYRELLQTMSPAEARAMLADRAAREAGLLGGGISVAAMSALPSAERALFSRGVSQSAIRRALGVGTGEAVSEGVEEGGGRFAQNVAVQRRADVERDLLQGVGGAATTGAILGGVMGGATGLIQRPPAAPSTEPGAGNLPPDLREAIDQYVANREPEGSDEALRLVTENLPVTADQFINATERDREILLNRARREAEGRAVDDVILAQAGSRADAFRFEEGRDQSMDDGRTQAEFFRERAEDMAREARQAPPSTATEDVLRGARETLIPPRGTPAEQTIRAVQEARPAQKPLGPFFPLVENFIEGHVRTYGDTQPVSVAALQQYVKERTGRIVDLAQARGILDTYYAGTQEPVAPSERGGGRGSFGGPPRITSNIPQGSGWILQRETAEDGTPVYRPVSTRRIRADETGFPVSPLPRMPRPEGEAETEPSSRAVVEQSPRGAVERPAPRRAVPQAEDRVLGVPLFQASARSVEGVEGVEGSEQTEPQPTEAAARTSRRVEAQDRINALYLNKLLGMGDQARLLRNGLIKALKNRDLSADQVYAAFVAADVMAQVLPKGANHRIEFVKSLLAPSSSTASRSGGTAGQEVQGLRWAPNQDGLEGLIQISLAPEQLDILGETAAHEAFHVLQDYFGRYDPKFADLMSRGFRDGMMITDVDPTIRRKLEQVKVPGSDQSYWQTLTATLSNPMDAKEAQAYVFGSLVDASRRGVPMSGLKPAFARFVNMVKNFFSKMGSALRGDGFQTVEQVLGRVVREGGRRFDQDVVPGARGPGAQASARVAPPFIRSVRQLLEDAKTASSWRDWYQRYEQQLEDLFGADTALFRQLLSATSQASGVAPNVTLALKAYEQLLTNKPFVGYLPAVIKNLERIRAEQSLAGQKISQYGKANETSKDAGEGVAVDRHVARLMFGVDKPNKAMVQKAIRTIQGIARILGWQPREVQAALWAFNQIKEGVDPTNVKSYDFYLAKKQDDIRTLRASISRGEGRSVLSGEAASRGVGEARAEGEQVEGGLTEPQAQASARATNTTVPEFRNWWNGGWNPDGMPGSSVAANPDGSPKVFYHGTPRSFRQFGKARSGAISEEQGPFFFTPDPEFASDYAESDLSAGGRGMPVKKGAKIYPVYLSVQNPFDYDDPDHVSAVLSAMDLRDSEYNEAQMAKIFDSVSDGSWSTLERSDVQRAIRELGFDGFYMNENGVKNLAVYDPRQVKSIFNQFQEGAATQPQFSARQVNTPEFQRWFGDSKVVDADGRPLNVYHGTRSGGFDYFKSNIRKGEQLGFGIHFSVDEDFARRYAEDEDVGRKGKSPQVYEVYLSVQNPLYADQIVYEGTKEFDLAKKLAGPKFFAQKDESGRNAAYMQNAIDSTSPQRAERLIKESGYDGVFYKSRLGKRTPYGTTYSTTSDSFIVFSPNQIKSATDNRGTFDPNDPRIQASARQVNTPEFKRWFGDSNVVDAGGRPLVLYRGLRGQKFLQGVETMEPREGYATFFSDSPYVAATYANPDMSFPFPDDAGAIFPVYVKADKLIEFPVQTDEAGRSRLDFSGFDKRARRLLPGEVLVARGVVDIGPRASRKADPEGRYSYPSDIYAIGRGTQTKSATGNRGTFDPNDPRIQASARTPPARTPSYSATIDKITGKQYDKPNPFSAALRAFTGALPGESNSSALLRTTVNRAAPGWMLDRLAKEKGLSVKSVGLALEIALNNSGRVQMYLDHGPLSYDPKTGDVKVRGDVPGLMAAIKGRLNPKDKREAQAYLVALRERDLRKAGKQGFFNITDAEISRIISTEERKHPDWKQMAADLQKINKALLEFAVNTGTLDQSKANQLANIFYTPFYRQAEEDGKSNADSVIGPRLSDSLTKVKTAFDVKMEGGESPLGDLFQNLIRNADVIMKAGMKNVAMRQAAEVMEAVGLGRKLKTRVAGKTMTYRVDGKDQHFEVDDPVLYMALAGAPREFTNGIYKAMATFAGFFRDMITLAPSFMMANLWRGKIMAYVQEGVPLYANTFGGLKQALQASASYKAIAAQTGFGGYTYGMGERDAAKAFEKEIEGLGYTSPRGLMRKAIKGLRDFSEATEMAERIKLYERAKAAGMSDKDAAFQAYLLAPFSRRGMGGGLAGDFVNFFVPLVPFLNAKIQGMYRLIENEKGDTQKIWTLGLPKQLLLRGLVVTGLSVALAAMNMDFEPDRWDNENPDLKFRYDIVYLPGGNRLLLPRAFEVGSVFGAIPVFIMDAIRREDGRDLAKALGDLGKSTFFFNPIPAAVVPLIGAYTNYDFFRARPLENAGDMRKLTEERINRSTTTAARLVGGAMGISPIRAQYLLEGYSGTIGASILAGLDNIFASLGMIPGKPAGAFGDPMSMPAIIAGLTGASRFYRSDDQSATRFIGDFYRIKEMTDQLVRSQNMATESRDLDRLAELRGAEGLPLRIRPMVNSASTRISEISARMARIERSDMDATSKAEALRSLRQQRDMIARNVVEAARRIGAY